MHIFSFFSFFFLVIFWIISHVPFHPILALQVYVLFLFSPCYLHTNYQSLKLIIILPSGKRPGPVQLRLRPPVPSTRTVAPLLVLCPCGPRWSAFHSQCRSNPYFCFPLWPPFLLASPFHLRLNSSCSTSFGISCWGGGLWVTDSQFLFVWNVFMSPVFWRTLVGGRAHRCLLSGLRNRVVAVQGPTLRYAAFRLPASRTFSHTLQISPQCVLV